MSPFFIEYGWNPRMAPDVRGELDAPSLEELFDNRIEAQEQAKAALTLAAERAKWYFDLHKQDVTFKVGDKVLLKGADIHIKPSKLAARNYGPFDIVDQLGPVTFELKLPRSYKVHPVYHASKLLPYHEDTIGNRQPNKPGQVEFEEQPVDYEVESIIDTRIERGKIQYLIKWKHYDDSENTWEPMHHLKHALSTLKEYHRNHPEAPHPISWTNATPVDTLFKR